MPMVDLTKEQLQQEIFEAIQRGKSERVKELMAQYNEQFGSESRITIMTAAPWGSSGDTAAAAKFIKELKSLNPEAKITWAVRRDAHSARVNPRGFGVPDDVEILDYDAPHDHNWSGGWSQLHTKDDIIKRMIESSMVVSFPTTHYMSRKNLDMIRDLGKPLACITEYDFQEHTVFKPGVTPPDDLKYMR